MTYEAYEHVLGSGFKIGLWHKQSTLCRISIIYFLFNWLIDDQFDLRYQRWRKGAKDRNFKSSCWNYHLVIILCHLYWYRKSNLGYFSLSIYLLAHIYVADAFCISFVIISNKIATIWKEIEFEQNLHSFYFGMNHAILSLYL